MYPGQAGAAEDVANVMALSAVNSKIEEIVLMNIFANLQLNKLLSHDRWICLTAFIENLAIRG